MSSEELCANLAANCKDGSHWSCDAEMLKLCKLSPEDFEKHTKKWWGNKDLWLDMFATELARTLGRWVDLSKRIGSGWQQAADIWIDATYLRATSHMNCPPPKAVISVKAAILAADVLKKLEIGNPLKVNMTSSIPLPRTTCNQCGKSYSPRLARCPICCPSYTQKDETKSQAIVEQKKAAWRNLSSIPIHADVPWSEASEMMYCHGGSGGVFLLRNHSGAVGVKAEVCNPAALFAQRYAHALNIRTPWMRAIPESSSELSQIIKALHSAEPTFDDDRLKLGGLRQGCTIMEYVDGCVMMGMPAHEYLKKGANNDELWYDLGRTIGFDLLINNFDRMPLAWLNEGNLTNIMLGSRMGNVVGIDQSVQPITHQAGMKNYIDRVKSACLEARDGEGKSFERVKRSIYNNTAIELSSAQMGDLRRGCLDFVTEISRLALSGEMEGILEMVSDDVSREISGGVSDKLVDSCCEFIRKVVYSLNGNLNLPIN